MKGQKSLHAMNRIWNVGPHGINVKRIVCERIVVLNVFYWAETWGLNERKKRRLSVMEIKILKEICRVKIRDRIRNWEIWRRVSMLTCILVKLPNGIIESLQFLSIY